MIPYSGGSSLEANFSAPYGGMTIDFASMNKILEIHQDDMDIVVQPSIQWMDLNEKIKDTGLFFPVDPGPSAMIGGMVGTNCSGTNAVRYGTMKDSVINLTVVLANGDIIKTRRRPRKTSAGYNLTGLFVGSEGTLGIVTEATLKLVPIPELTRVGVVAFPTVRDCASTAMQVIKKGIQVQCMEIMDEVQMDVINRAGGTGRTWGVSPTLFFKFSGTTAGVADSINLTRELAKNNVRRHMEQDAICKITDLNDRTPLNSHLQRMRKKHTTCGLLVNSLYGVCWPCARRAPRYGQRTSLCRSQGCPISSKSRRKNWTP